MGKLLTTISALALAGVTAFGGWTWYQQADPITKVVNAKLRPINVDQQRQAAIDSTAKALSRLAAPNLRVSVKFSEARKLLLTERLKSQGLVELFLKGDKQLMRVQAKFSRKFTEEDSPDNQELKQVLALLKPDISGTLMLYLGLSGALASTGDVRELQFKLLPIIGAVELKKVKVTVAGNIEITKAADAVASILSTYKDNITAELTSATFSTVSVPGGSAETFDPRNTFTIRNSEADGNEDVQVQGDVIKARVKVDGIAWLVDDDRFIALAQLLPIEATSTPGAPTANTFDAIKGKIDDFGRELIGIEYQAPSTSVAVRKDILAWSLSNLMEQIAPCITVRGETAEQVTSTKVRPPKRVEMDCSPTRDCTPTRVCNFQVQRDTRDCGGACLMRNPFSGDCMQPGMDPVCEVAKASQNKIYDADAAAKKLDCERLKSSDKLSCEADKAGSKGLCEAGKVVLDRIAEMGDFGTLDINTKFSSGEAKVCLPNFQVSPTLDRVQFLLDVSGRGSADINVNFVPLDIGTSLICRFPETPPQTIVASLRGSTLGSTSALKLVTTQNKARLDYSVDESVIKVRLSPSPTEYLATKNMAVTCEGLNLTKPIVVSLTPYIPLLRSDLDHKVKGEEHSLRLTLPDQRIGTTTLRLGVVENRQVLVLPAESDGGKTECVSRFWCGPVF
jgi:hypothetical protein